MKLFCLFEIRSRVIIPSSEYILYCALIFAVVTSTLSFLVVLEAEQTCSNLSEKVDGYSLGPKQVIQGRA